MKAQHGFDIRCFNNLRVSLFLLGCIDRLDCEVGLEVHLQGHQPTFRNGEKTRVEQTLEFLRIDGSDILLWSMEGPKAQIMLRINHNADSELF